MRWKQKTEQKEMGEEPEKLHLDWITTGDSRLQENYTTGEIQPEKIQQLHIRKKIMAPLDSISLSNDRTQFHCIFAVTIFQSFRLQNPYINANLSW